MRKERGLSTPLSPLTMESLPVLSLSVSGLTVAVFVPTLVGQVEIHVAPATGFAIQQCLGHRDLTAQRKRFEVFDIHGMSPSSLIAR